MALHSRTLFGDLRDQPLKLLIMSATLDGCAISELMADEVRGPAPVVRSEGKMYPVDLRYGAAYQFGERIVDRVVNTVVQAVEEESGSVLVFLPGQGEIRQAAEQLKERLAIYQDIQLAPLFGDLSLAEQRNAIAPCREGRRKVVLATSIAETSLTIEGVRVVIDSGLSRLPVFDPRSGLTRLTTQRVSRASATQRAGRAGRLEPGVCYRLWSANQDNELAAFTPAEILNADLAGLALQLLNWGVERPEELPWLDVPGQAAFSQALDLLQRLEAVTLQEEHCRITPMGMVMAQMASHPRLAHMMIKGKLLEQEVLACQLAALLGERDPGRDMADQLGADVRWRLELLSGERKASRGARGAIERIKKQARRYQQQLQKLNLASLAGSQQPRKLNDDIASGLLLAFAYPDRIAMARASRKNVFQMSNGRAAECALHDDLANFLWLVILDAGGLSGRNTDRIFMAATLDQSTFQLLFSEQILEKVQIEWDEREEKLLAQSFLEFGRLRFNQQRITNLTDDQRRDALLDLVRRRGLSLFERSEAFEQWQSRLLLVREHDQRGSWPDVSDEGLLRCLDQWLAPYLQGNSLLQLTRLSHFKKLDFLEMVQTLLPWDLQQQLNQLVPTHIEVPSGSRVRIDYRESPPVLAVKLQEMFGCEATPTVINGEVALMVHLLSPARRPLQVTQDLAGFWRGSYEQVKKEMKGRYPKHPWPDDPMQAIATAKTKAKM